MDQDLEVVTGAALAGGRTGARRKTHIPPPGTPCASCETPLQGAYCHECGQLAEGFHRSVGHLLVEAFESFFHFDGRFWNTVPRLLLKPAQLTRDYLEGRRATQIPPLRLFLVAVLVFFLAGSVSDMFGPETDLATQQATQLSVRDATGAVSIKIDKSDKTPSVLSRWFIPRVQYAATHQREFKMAIEEWLHRVAILLLPVVALLMTALFAFQRRFYVYDHVIFSMHALSFLFLLLSVQTLLARIPFVGDFAGLLFLLAPVHLFVHMRGVYGVGIFGAVWREVVLYVLGGIGFGLMMLVVVLVGLNNIGAA